MIKLLHNEHDVKRYVQSLKNFYGELSVYVLLVAISLVIWLLTGLGYFWPVWIVLTWGIILFLKASRLQIVDSVYYELCHTVREKMPFIKSEWQEEKVQEMVRKMNLKNSSQSSFASSLNKPSATQEEKSTNFLNSKNTGKVKKPSLDADKSFKAVKKVPEKIKDTIAKVVPKNPSKALGLKNIKDKGQKVVKEAAAQKDKIVKNLKKKPVVKTVSKVVEKVQKEVGLGSKKVTSKKADSSKAFAKNDPKKVIKKK